ncbi:MAG: alpha-galactosidase [Lachnospiraceae bacterium]|nr:alpha-galactosidase [Lachnospiraceae bacterium]MDE7201097.1 alpha-galactosidase [Lachnospiraceae bacterium]
MSIIVDEKEKIFTLHTKNTTYQMKADVQGTFLHVYYGERSDDSDKSYVVYIRDRGFSGNPYELGKENRAYSLDILPQEYSCFGTGDFRISALKIQNEDGSLASVLCYRGYNIHKGKYSIPNLPAVYAEDGTADTLEIILEDSYSKVEVHLLYGVLEENDIITRAVKIMNQGDKNIVLQKAASMNLDWINGEYDWITFYGGHVKERTVQRSELDHGIHSIGSVRGTSSHHYNPFVLVSEKNTDEEKGGCYAFSFLYSGEFQMEAEKDQVDQTRLICGIHPDNFAWNLRPGEAFDTPEVMMTYSAHGFGAVSRNLHKTIRKNICRGEWKENRRPVLINNWEATYFNFTGEKLVAIAKDAVDLGVELFVLDDGWFGKRDDDNSGLGDWFPNEKKLGCTLKELAERIVECGLQFGLWFEPECISEDSDLYREHPDWAVAIPGRKPILSRNQLILDFSREDVQDHIIDRMSAIFADTPITYVKWDFNRSVCDKYSKALDAQGQGEFAHRYVLGLYRVLEILTTKFPHILFEGCSGGGGRFDTGMLYYTPQIWCSDNTDAIARLGIQYGTSFCYPVSTMGAHVSAVPNHQTCRITPFSTRGCVAMAGTFGYELDVTKLTKEEKEQVRRQIETFKEYYDLIQYGEYYRLLSPSDEQCTAWEMADPEGREALVSVVYHHVMANAAPVIVKVYGLKANANYQIHLNTDGMESLPDQAREWFMKNLPYGYKEGEKITGLALQQCGLVIPDVTQGFQAWQIHIVETSS